MKWLDTFRKMANKPASGGYVPKQTQSWDQVAIPRPDNPVLAKIDDTQLSDFGNEVLMSMRLEGASWGVTPDLEGASNSKYGSFWIRGRRVYHNALPRDMLSQGFAYPTEKQRYLTQADSDQIIAEMAVLATRGYVEAEPKITVRNPPPNVAAGVGGSGMTATAVAAQAQQKQVLQQAQWDAMQRQQNQALVDFLKNSPVRDDSLDAFKFMAKVQAPSMVPPPPTAALPPELFIGKPIGKVANTIGVDINDLRQFHSLSKQEQDVILNRMRDAQLLL